MKVRAGALALGLAVVVAGPVAAQGHAGHGADHQDMHAAPPATGLRAELIRDVEQLERKYMGLARAMTGKYDWRPAEGVRSAGEVFGHVAGANFMIPSMAGVSVPESMAASSMQEGMRRMRELERSGDEARILESLEHSFRHATHALADVSDAQLEEQTKMFGQDVTKRQVLTLLVMHMHEHLGQAIAYARMNGVTPPWSEGGN
ncbi:MAG TPA: DinB family protein [Longimicrobiales bacterium]|nr:DinB family protein [Longimicrobiales bacterium]